MIVAKVFQGIYRGFQRVFKLVVTWQGAFRENTVRCWEGGEEQKRGMCAAAVGMINKAPLWTDLASCYASSSCL
jgi:hypothetical protein